MSYFEFVKWRVCPSNHEWSDLKQCLNADWQSRAAWLPYLRDGRTLTKAIELSITERNGAWAWASGIVPAQYASIAGGVGLHRWGRCLCR